MFNKRSVLAFLVAFAACAAEAAGTLETPLLDPWVPPALREKRAVEAPAEGAALRAEVERKLRAAFEAAAKPYGGTLAREQARDAGFGFIANHFEAIDRRGAGRVAFEDYRRFLRERSPAPE